MTSLTGLEFSVLIWLGISIFSYVLIKDSFSLGLIIILSSTLVMAFIIDFAEANKNNWVTIYKMIRGKKINGK